ncbi:hypothetical protein EFY87_14755 [Flexivirga caeni]|uniref:Uncharacterized protein n=1 Tax=Flexivirga caeni TaxID=2294115 RepID=A0A3M9M5N8_9MICO|nr:hypothetical protein EFY87_14755 [Flexivirga caeni]
MTARQVLPQGVAYGAPQLALAAPLTQVDGEHMRDGLRRFAAQRSIGLQCERRATRVLHLGQRRERISDHGVAAGSEMVAHRVFDRPADDRVGGKHFQGTDAQAISGTGGAGHLVDQQV